MSRSPGSGGEDRSSCAIAEVQDGETVTLRGTIRRARPALLVAPLSDRECVAWEVRAGLRAESRERGEAVDFWLEDESGKVLVRPHGVEIEARARREEEAISIVDADIAEVEAQLRELKLLRKRVGGKAASDAHKGSKRLRKLATLLYAIRAHARGNVHIGGTLARQERMIEERSSAFEAEGEGSRSLSLMSERFELVLLEGSEVEARGLAERAPMPAGIGAGGGYRDRPTCMQLVAPSGGSLLLRGLGELAPLPAQRPAQRGGPSGGRPSGASQGGSGLSKAELEDLRRRPPKGERGLRAALILVAIGLAGYFLYLLDSQ